MESIDILITSASRPDCLYQAMESFKKYIKFYGEFRWYLHEDVVLKKESDEIITWAINSKLFEKILVTCPAKRLIKAVLKLLNEAKTKYILKLEDDWIFTDYVDLNYITATMDINPEINQIYFNKANQPTKVIIKNGMRVIAPEGKGPHEWAMAPGVWRLDFIKPRWHDDTSAYAVIFSDDIVGDYLYGKDEGKQNIHHIGKVSTSKVAVEQ